VVELSSEGHELILLECAVAVLPIDARCCKWLTLVSSSLVPMSCMVMQAGTAISELRNAVDTLIIVANDKLLEIIPPNTPLERAFGVADDILRQVRV
jgi:hypothetical protein